MLFFFFFVCFACWFGTENPGCSVVSDMIWFDSVLGSVAIFLWLGGGSLSYFKLVLMLTIAYIFRCWIYHASTHLCIVLMHVYLLSGLVKAD